MRNSLRVKILLLAVLMPATLGLATLLTVSRNVTAHVNSSSIHESLEHTEAVFENMLRARSRALVGDGRVIARDPRFFSLLMLAPGQQDERFTMTMRGMAQDFNRIVQTELFEIFDRRGRKLVSVGPASSALTLGDVPVADALKGRTIEVVLVKDGKHYQVALVPVRGGNRVVGVLLLGVQIGESLARQLRSQMHCEVTFLCGTLVTGSSLDSPGDRGALVLALKSWRSRLSSEVVDLPVQQVHAAKNTYLTLVRRIPLSDPTTGQLYVMQRAFDPETSFLHIMERDMLILAVIALLAALITGLLFSEQILRPIQSLVRGAQEMEKGNYDYPLGIRRRDELGYLADRFVDMRQRERAYLGSLEQATRLKSHFLTIASHELRTPISVITGYRDILAAGELGPITTEQREVLETMRRHLERLTRVAEDAAHFARVKSERVTLDFEIHEAEALVRRSAALASAAGANRSVRVEIVCESPVGSVEADAGDLEQALVQLITNGIRFTPDGGEIWIHVREADGRLRVAIRDTGVGLAQEKLDAMLSGEPAVPEAGNYRSPAGLEFNAAGLGLGLPIARSIIEAHGGSIIGTSRVGEGTTLVVEIPLLQPDETRAA